MGSCRIHSAHRTGEALGSDTQTHTHAHARTRSRVNPACACVCGLTHAHARTHAHTRTHTHAHAHTRARTHTHTHTYLGHAHTRTYAHTYIYRARTHVHTHIHRYLGVRRACALALTRYSSRLDFCARINHPCIAPPPTYIAHTVAIRLQSYCAIFDPPPSPPFVCHTPYNIVHGNMA